MATGEKKEEELAVSVPDNPVEKHPLQNKWALWYYKNDKNKDWKDCLKMVISFDTVEDFWSVYNHIKQPSQVPSGCDYMLFKDGIEPMWEDIKNKKGGRWLFNVDKQYRRNSLDPCWMETLMCLIGEGFGECSDEVNGAVVQIRSKGDKMAIWTGDSTKSEHIMHIGRTYKERLNMHLRGNRPSVLVYQSHKDVMSKTGSVSKSMHTLEL